MPPTLVLIRHAEALHNVKQDYSIPDPQLTALGRQQCIDLREHFGQNLPLINKVEAIVVSPMRRTLETMQLAFEPLIQKGVTIEPDADWQENSDKPCDTGTKISAIQHEFPDVDFSLVDPTYPDKTSRCKDGSANTYAWTKKAVLARAQRCLAKLYARPEKVIAVVTHSGFLRLGISHTMYANADYRVFDFAPVKAEDGKKVEHGLEEWEQTRAPGGGMGKSPKGPWQMRPEDFPPEVQSEGKLQVNGEAADERP